MEVQYRICLFFIVTMKYAVDGEICNIPVESISQRVYYGWPVLLSCHDLAMDCDLGRDSYKCNVMRADTNETVFSGDLDYDDDDAILPSYNIANVTNETPSVLVINIQGEDDCCSPQVRLKKFVLPNNTCAEFHESYEARTRETTPRESKVISCELPETTNEPRLKLSDYEIQWYHNCERQLPDDIFKDGTDKLSISSFDQFKHTGHYSCAIRHNGETRFIDEKRFCVKPRRSIPNVGLECNTREIRYNIGDTATIDCVVNVGESYADDIDQQFNMIFIPLLNNGTNNPSRTNVSCTSKLQVGRSSPTYRSTSHDDRVSCSLIRIQKAKGPICLTQIPTREEWEREKNKTSQTLIMTYNIKNLTPDDFGLYEAYVHYMSPSNNATQRVQIVMDMGERERAGLIGGVLAGTVVALILLAALLYYFRLNLRLLWKKSSCVPHDKSTMTYGAYFTYSWSNDSGEAMANNTYGDLILGMRNFVQELGFKIYDPAVEPAQCQWTILNTKEVQQNCDRVIVILTEKFLEQPTAEQDLYESFLDKTFILIKTPKFEDAFKSLDQDRKNGLKAHFQRNYTINWSGKGGALSNKFRMELELAMPKKRKSQSGGVSFSILQKSV